VVFVPEVLDSGVVTATEGGSVGVAICMVDMRMTILIAVVHVGHPVVVEVLSGALNAVGKAATFYLVVLSGWSVPSGSVVVVVIAVGMRRALSDKGIGGTDWDGKSKRCDCA
jgi:hypothetical protein